MIDPGRSPSPSVVFGSALIDSARGPAPRSATVDGSLSAAAWAMSVGCRDRACSCALISLRLLMRLFCTFSTVLVDNRSCSRLMGVSWRFFRERVGVVRETSRLPMLPTPAAAWANWLSPRLGFRSWPRKHLERSRRPSPPSAGLGQCWAPVPRGVPRLPVYRLARRGGMRWRSASHRTSSQSSRRWSKQDGSLGSVVARAIVVGPGPWATPVWPATDGTSSSPCQAASRRVRVHRGPRDHHRPICQGAAVSQRDHRGADRRLAAA